MVVEICRCFFSLPTHFVLKYAGRFHGGEGGVGFERIVRVPWYIRFCEWISDIYIIEQGGEYFVQVGKEINR